MLHALRSERRGDALEHMHELCWNTGRPFSLVCGILCRCEANKARRARVDLAAKRVRPQWTWAKPAAKRRHTTSLTSLGDYIEMKYRRTIRSHATYSAVTFSTSKGPNFTLSRPFCQLVTPADGPCCETQLLSVKFRACSLISSQLHTARHPSIPLNTSQTHRQSASHLHHPPVTTTPSF